MPVTEATVTTNSRHRRIRWEPLQYSYFRLLFRKVVEKKIDNPQGRLTRMIKLITGEVKELVKPFIHDNSKYDYENAMKLLERQYGNPFKLLACYRNEKKNG